MPTNYKSISTFVMFSNELMEQIETYRDESGLRTTNETIRTLIKKGLEGSQE